MKKIIVIVLLCTCFQSIDAQCWKYKKGQVVFAKSILYANGLPITEKKWPKMKDEDRGKLIMTLNDDINSGKMAPYTTTSAKFEVTNVQEDNNVMALTMKMVETTYPYQTTNYCYNDTSYMVRNKDVVFSVLSGDTIGFAIQGVQRIPDKLKVGDVLPPYRDYSFSMPESWTNTIKEKVFAFSYNTSSIKSGVFTDTQTGVMAYGDYKVTERHDVYDQIKHQVKITENVQGLTIHYNTAVVTGEEELDLNGVKVNSFIIESESWNKSELIKNFEAENERIAMQTKANYDAFSEKLAKKATKRGYTNEQGYTIQYRKEWFVPGYGIMMSETYDNWGAIQSRSRMEFKK